MDLKIRPRKQGLLQKKKKDGKLPSNLWINQWQFNVIVIKWDTYFLGLKNHCNSDCSHEIKKSLLLGRKANDKPSQSVQSLSHVRLFETLSTTAHQASLSITNSWSLLKLMSIRSVMPSNNLILCHPLLLLPSIFPSIRVFSSESVLPLEWTGLISLQSKGLSRVFSNTTVQKHRFFGTQLSLWSNSHIRPWLLEKP